MRYTPPSARPARSGFLRRTGAALGAGCILLAGWGASLSASAQVPPVELLDAGAGAIAACERAARQSAAAQLTQPAEVTFDAPPVVQQDLSNDRQLVLRGTGRWVGATTAHRFSYSCNVDARTSRAVGVVLRDSTPAVRRAARPAPAEPDLSHVSLEACESSAVFALKQRWPRVSQISFDSATRSLRQESVSTAKLRGRGRALPLPGAPATFFGFDCELDPRDGRVLATRLSG